MRNQLFLVLMLMVFAACQQPRTSINIQHDGKYWLIDSTAKTDSFRVYNAKNRFAWYSVYYLGHVKNINALRPQPISASFGKNYQPNATGRLFDKNISIFVDTALDISHKSIYNYLVDNQYIEKKAPVFATDSVKHFKAYPVFINLIAK